MTSKFRFHLERDLSLSQCSKIINLITSHLFAQRNKTHLWVLENIFTEAEAESVYKKDWILLWKGANGSG